jgi:hypothetical protein
VEITGDKREIVAPLLVEIKANSFVDEYIH